MTTLVVAESNQITMAQPEVAALFRDGGICDNTKGSQLEWLSGSTQDSVSFATNVRYFTGWYAVMASLMAKTADDGYTHPSRPPSYWTDEENGVLVL